MSFFGTAAEEPPGRRRVRPRVEPAGPRSKPSWRQPLQLTSPAFADGAPVPVEHAAKRVGGRETSPPLSWSPAPEGAAELLPWSQAHRRAAPGHGGRRRTRPPAVRAPHRDDRPRRSPAELPGRRCSTTRTPAPGGVRLLRSTVGSGYIGPAPIKGHGPHRYVFQLFALPAPRRQPDAAVRGAHRPARPARRRPRPRPRPFPAHRHLRALAPPRAQAKSRSSRTGACCARSRHGNPTNLASSGRSCAASPCASPRAP